MYLMRIGPAGSERPVVRVDDTRYIDVTGETGRVGSPKRREVGHGALAERALVPVLPGLWSVEWQCAPGKLTQILDLVRATLADVAADCITEKELARAKGSDAGANCALVRRPGGLGANKDR